MRKYRILEEKFENVSHFYPQYRDENVAYYILRQDENGKDIKSDYQYFSKWQSNSFGDKVWAKDMFFSLKQARNRIEIDIKHRKIDELKKIIIHEY